MSAWTWREADELARQLDVDDARMVLARVAVDAPDLVGETIERLLAAGHIAKPHPRPVRFGVDVTDEH
jgi:3-deoxy-D-arabino-heptulosonate 7-phosphate (DAHP) synthase